MENQSLHNLLNNTNQSHQKSIKKLLRELTQTLLDSSSTMVQVHRALNEDGAGLEVKKPEKLAKVHKELKNTINYFRERFAVVLGDIKYLTSSEDAKERIEDLAGKLENDQSKKSDKELGGLLLDLTEVVDPSRSLNYAGQHLNTPGSKQGLQNQLRDLTVPEFQKQPSNQVTNDYRHQRPISTISMQTPKGRGNSKAREMGSGKEQKSPLVTDPKYSQIPGSLVKTPHNHNKTSGGMVPNLVSQETVVRRVVEPLQPRPYNQLMGANQQTVTQPNGQDHPQGYLRLLEPSNPSNRKVNTQLFSENVNLGPRGIRTASKVSSNRDLHITPRKVSPIAGGRPDPRLIHNVAIGAAGQAKNNNNLVGVNIANINNITNTNPHNSHNRGTLSARRSPYPPSHQPFPEKTHQTSVKEPGKSQAHAGTYAKMIGMENPLGLELTGKKDLRSIGNHDTTKVSRSSRNVFKSPNDNYNTFRNNNNTNSPINSKNHLKRGPNGTYTIGLMDQLSVAPPNHGAAAQQSEEPSDGVATTLNQNTDPSSCMPSYLSRRNLKAMVAGNDIGTSRFQKPEEIYNNDIDLKVMPAPQQLPNNKRKYLDNLTSQNEACNNMNIPLHAMTSRKARKGAGGAEPSSGVKPVKITPLPHTDSKAKGRGAGGKVQVFDVSGRTTHVQSVKNTPIRKLDFKPVIVKGELKTAEIKDPKSYFNNINIKKSNINMKGLIRIEGINPFTQAVYTYGDGVEQELLLKEGGSLEAAKKTQTKQHGAVIYSRITKNGFLLTVHQGSNNLNIFDLTAKKLVKQFRGYPEEPYGFDKFRSLRYAKEDEFPIWRRGNDTVVLLHPINFDPLAEFNKFWPKDYTPMFINVSGNMDRIYGYSLNRRGGILTVLSHFSNPELTRTDYIKIPQLETWAGMEQNTAGDLLIVSVQARSDPQYLNMIAYDVSNLSLKAVSKKMFNSSQFKIVQFMRKVKGYDYFMVACRNSIAVFCFTGKDFVLLNFMENLYIELIFEIMIFGNTIIPLSIGGEEPIKVIEFDKDGYGVGGPKVDLAGRKANGPATGLSNKGDLMAGVFVSQKIRKMDVPAMKGTKKVRISPDGKTMFFGGDGGLQILRRYNTRDTFELAKRDPELKFFGIRGTPSGHFLIQLKGSNNLVVFNRKLKQEFEFKSQHADTPATLAMNKEPHFSFEGDYMIWFGGKNTLHIIDLTSLSQLKIDNFVSQDVSPEPIYAVADFAREKYLICYEIEDEFVLVFSEREREPDLHLLEEKFPKYSDIKCMDLTKNKLYGVASGWTEDTDSVSGKAFSKGCISAFKFTRSLDLVAEIELPKRKCSVVSKVCWSKTHEDVLFACSDGPLFVLGFHPTINQFEVLKAIDINNSALNYVDMCIFGKCLYLTAEDDDSHITEIKFKNMI